MPREIWDGNVLFGTALANARESKNLTQTSLAAELGLTTGAVSQYENGLALPKRDTASRMAVVLEGSTEAVEWIWACVKRTREIKKWDKQRVADETRRATERSGAQGAEFIPGARLREIAPNTGQRKIATQFSSGAASESESSVTRSGLEQAIVEDSQFAEAASNLHMLMKQSPEIGAAVTQLLSVVANEVRKA